MISENLIERIKTLPLETQKVDFSTLLEITNKKLEILQSGKSNLPFVIGAIRSLKQDKQTLENLISELSTDEAY